MYDYTRLAPARSKNIDTGLIVSQRRPGLYSGFRMPFHGLLIFSERADNKSITDVESGTQGLYNNPVTQTPPLPFAKGTCR